MTKPFKKEIPHFFFHQGGMKAVIWTDVLQTLVMLTGILAAIIQGCEKIFNKINGSKFIFRFHKTWWFWTSIFNCMERWQNTI